ncbi:hypothetical protein HY383_04310 [Candidatus Daviesbacteria bacterium]|nr:hypothetical protein [Candidatus Daviesbacteria bacterium]
MNIEIGSVGASVSVGLSVAVGPAVASGIGAGLGARFGPSLIGPESYTPTIINEGSVASSFLENSVTLAKFNPVGEIKFNSPLEGNPSVNIPQTEEFLAPLAEPKVIRPSWGMVVPRAEALAVPQAISRNINYLRPDVSVFPVLEPETKQETGVSSKTVPATLVQPNTQEIEEVVEEEKMTEKEQEIEEETEDNDDSLLKVKFIEAVNISKSRKQEIKSAIRRLKGKITGRILKEAISTAFWKLKSPIVGEGRDYTIDLTAGDIESDPTEYQSQAEAEKAWVKVVEEHTPVKKGEGGKVATIEQLREVTHGERQKTKQSKNLAEIITRRVIRKEVILRKIGTLRVLKSEDKKEINGEITLQELSPQLAEVFQQAA